MLRGQDSAFQNYNKIFEELHTDWNTHKQPIFNMKKKSKPLAPSLYGVGGQAKPQMHTKVSPPSSHFPVNCLGEDIVNICINALIK